MDEGDRYIQNVHNFTEFILSVGEHWGWYEELLLNIPQLFFFNPVFACIYFFMVQGKYSPHHVLNCRMLEKYNFSMSRKIKVVIQTVPLITMFEVDGEWYAFFNF